MEVLIALALIPLALVGLVLVGSLALWAAPYLLIAGGLLLWVALPRHGAGSEGQWIGAAMLCAGVIWWIVRGEKKT